MAYILKFDGCCVPNPGEMGIGVVVYNEDKEKIIELSERCGLGTNNQAEYKALIMGLEELSILYRGHVKVYGDSQLVINHMLKKFRVNKKELKPFYNNAKELESQFQHVDYELIPRIENNEADILSAKALDIDQNNRIENRIFFEKNHIYEFVFDSDSKIKTVRDETNNRNVQRYYVKSTLRDGKNKNGTYFQTGAKKVNTELENLKPLENKKVKIIITKPKTYFEFVVELIEV